MLSILIGFVCLLLSAFLVAVPSKRKQPNLFLAAFLTLTAIELSVWLWGRSGFEWTAATALWYALGRLQMPAFFFFFLSACYSDVRLRAWDALHWVPFGLSLMAAWPGAPDLPLIDAGFAPDGRASWVVSQLFYFGYMIAIVTLLWRFASRFRQVHSGARSELLVWLGQMVAASLLARVILLARDLLGFATDSDIALAMQYVSAVLALLITSWIALKSLLQPDLFRDVDRRILALSTNNGGASQGDLARVKDHMLTHTPYLDAGLNLETLADQLAMTSRELSELLNGSAGVHFFDFVNGYRIDHAKDLLVTRPDQSILTILYASGFNSKSSFNAAFKKHAGLTPSAFRSQARSA